MRLKTRTTVPADGRRDRLPLPDAEPVDRDIGRRPVAGSPSFTLNLSLNPFLALNFCAEIE